MYSHNRKKGFSVVEIVISAAIITAFITAVGGGWQIYLKTTRDATNLTMTANLMDEGAEAMQLLRDLGWTENIAPLTSGTTYDLYWDSLSLSYKTSTSPQLIQNLYRRTVTLSDVNRDPFTGNIVLSEGTLDPNTKLVTINIYLGISTNTKLGESQVLVFNTYEN